MMSGSCLKIERSAVEVIMGAGHPEYDNNGSMRTDEPSYNYVGGQELWSRLLLCEVAFAT